MRKFRVKENWNKTKNEVITVSVDNTDGLEQRKKHERKSGTVVVKYCEPVDTTLSDHGQGDDEHA